MNTMSYIEIFVFTAAITQGLLYVLSPNPPDIEIGLTLKGMSVLK